MYVKRVDTQDCGRNVDDVLHNPRALAIGARKRGCLTCEYFQGEFCGGHVVCERFERDRVIGDAMIGCAYWQRELGADDD